MNEPESIEFPELSVIPGLRAAFIGRIPGIDVDADRETALARLNAAHLARLIDLGVGAMPLITAEQVHGSNVAVVGLDSVFPVADCDGLVTREKHLCLGIYVADCAAVFLADRTGRAIGLVHSGKKGTELGIVPKAVEAVCQVSGGTPGEIVATISPCIRPPHYEIDFAATIRGHLSDAGVGEVHDDGICTATHSSRFYSYRRAKGRTGRMLAVMALS